MPWKPPAATAATVAPTATMTRPKSATAKSIRGTISAPIPQPDATNLELSTYIPPYLLASELAPNHIQLYPAPTAAPLPPPTTAPPPPPPAIASVIAPWTANPEPPLYHTTMSKPVHDKFAPKEGGQANTTRKPSPFRNALGRLFRKRNRIPGRLSTASMSSQPASAPDPSTINMSAATRHRNSTASRSISMPVSDYDRALRSHSVGLDDVDAIRSARTSTGFYPTRVKKQSISIANPPYPLGARYIGDGKFAGLYPRPASVNDRDLHASMSAIEYPDEIGCAITSDSRDYQRRSQSMSALVLSKNEKRPRSLEFKDSRASGLFLFDTLSPMSSVFPTDETTAAFDLGLPHPPRPTVPEPGAPEEFFSFGNLISDEEAANRLQIDNIIDSPVNVVENTRQILGDDATSLSHSQTSPYAMHADDFKPNNTLGSAGLKIQTSFTHSNARQRHHSLAMGIPTSACPFQPSPIPQSSQGDGINARNNTAARRISQQGVTIRPISECSPRHEFFQSPQCQQQQHRLSLNEERCAMILGMLETERAARIELQTQVQQLTQQLQTITRQCAKSSKQYRFSSHGAPDVNERYNSWHPYQVYSLDRSRISTSPTVRSSGVMPHEMSASVDDVCGDDFTSSSQTPSPSQSQIFETPSEGNPHLSISSAVSIDDENISAARVITLSRMKVQPISKPIM